jgi:hypothetical protein
MQGEKKRGEKQEKQNPEIAQAGLFIETRNISWMFEDSEYRNHKVHKEKIHTKGH